MKENLKSNTEGLDDVLNIAQMGVWRIELFDNETPRMYVSAKMSELLGLDSEKDYTPEQIYDAWYSHILPEAIQSVTESVNKMLSGQHDENTYQWVHPANGVRYVRCGGIAHKVDGKGYNIQGYHYDVTDIVKKEKEQQGILVALANTYGALYHIDLEKLTYTAYSSTIDNVTRLVPVKGDLLPAFETFKKYLCHPDYEEVINRFIDIDTLQKRLMKTNAISLQFRGATLDWAEVSLRVCQRDSEGKATHLILSIQDISLEKIHEQEQMEKIKASIEESKTKTVMLQNMTHELRTPLNAMFGFSQLLSLPDGCVTEAEKAEYFNYIYNSFNMLTMHIDDVLDMADVEHGNYRVQIGEVHVNDNCRTALQMAETRRPSDVNMYFTSEVDDNYTIQSDGRRIQQVLINYLTNACKHTQEGEIHVHVSTKEIPGRLTFSVTDTGEGIPLEMQKDIFERYKKAKGNTAQGSGLGLNICSVIASKLNGEVKIDSTYTNGARFLFIL